MAASSHDCDSAENQDVDVVGEDEDDPDVRVQAKEIRREHHNSLERKRRDHIKDKFSLLQNTIPTLREERASRQQILSTATEYIREMRERNRLHAIEVSRLQKDTDSMQKQIRVLLRKKRVSRGISQPECTAPGQSAQNFTRQANDVEHSRARENGRPTQNSTTMIPLPFPVSRQLTDNRASAYLSPGMMVGAPAPVSESLPVPVSIPLPAPVPVPVSTIPVRKRRRRRRVARSSEDAAAQERSQEQ